MPSLLVISSERMKNKLTSHTIVKNGEMFIEQVLKSLIGRVKEIKIVDTGSTDKTVDIINSFIGRNYDNITKIGFKRVGPFKGTWKEGIPELTKLRNQMLSETKTEWAVIVDDDEIWTEELWFELYELLKIIPKHSMAITAPFIDFVDIHTIVVTPIQSPANRIVRASKVEYRGDWPNEMWFVKNEKDWLNKFVDKRVLHLKTPYYHYGRLKKKNNVVRPEENINTVPFIGEHPKVIMDKFARRC